MPSDKDYWAICGPDTAAVGRTMGCLDAQHPAAEANAALIAAAPSMFEAGERLAAWAARAVERWESGDLAEAVRELNHARRAWLAAVARAVEIEENEAE